MGTSLANSVPTNCVCQPEASNRCRTSSVNVISVLAGQRDLVVVVQRDQFAQAEVAGERGGFVRDPFHQVAVAGEHIGVMVDDRFGRVVDGRQMRFGDRHADGVGEALSERPGRHFDARRVVVLGMARRLAAQLPERFEIVEREVVARTGAAARRAAPSRVRRLR